jgi:uncharacterized protein (UPF0210 family)
MKIRSITYFFNPGWPLDKGQLKKAADFGLAARPAYETAGYEVQTTRLATPPFAHILPSLESNKVVPFARELEKFAADEGYDYIAIGPALPEIPASYPLIPEVLAATDIVFASGVIAHPKGDISLPAARACADVIHRTAPLDPNGFGNLYFTALANVPPGSPFFPAAYHDNGPPRFALATEAADLAVGAFRSASSLAEARTNLVADLEHHSQVMKRTSDEMTRQFDLPWGGIDFSLAPFPTEASSVGTAMECLGAIKVGQHGSLFAVAFLTEALERASFQRVGFSGVMLPVLEDSILAARAGEGLLTVEDLLLYSAVCGTGLDTVPLPGDTSVEEITAVLLDLATLAQRLDKPLTARLMPIPGKKAGDVTGFDFPFFANSKVLSLKAAPLGNILTTDEGITLKPYC